MSGYTLSQKKTPTSSFLKKIITLPNIPDEMMQEEVLEYPDFVVLTVKNRPELTWSAFIPSDQGIPFKESEPDQVDPDARAIPPEHLFS